MSIAHEMYKALEAQPIEQMDDQEIEDAFMQQLRKFAAEVYNHEYSVSDVSTSLTVKFKDYSVIQIVQTGDIIEYQWGTWANENLSFNKGSITIQ